MRLSEPDGDEKQQDGQTNDSNVENEDTSEETEKDRFPQDRQSILHDLVDLYRILNFFLQLLFLVCQKFSTVFVNLNIWNFKLIYFQ